MEVAVAVVVAVVMVVVVVEVVVLFASVALDIADTLRRVRLGPPKRTLSSLAPRGSLRSTASITLRMTSCRTRSLQPSWH